MPMVRWQGCGAPGGAPGGEVAPVARVGLPGRQRLLRLGVFQSPVAWVLSALQNPTPLIRALECVAILGRSGIMSGPC